MKAFYGLNLYFVLKDPFYNEMGIQTKDDAFNLPIAMVRNRVEDQVNDQVCLPITAQIFREVNDHNKFIV